MLAQVLSIRAGEDPTAADEGGIIPLPLVVNSCGNFRKLGVPYFGVLIIRILLFKARKMGPRFSETSMLRVAVVKRGCRTFNSSVSQNCKYEVLSCVHTISGTMSMLELLFTVEML